MVLFLITNIPYSWPAYMGSLRAPIGQKSTFGRIEKRTDKEARLKKKRYISLKQLFTGPPIKRINLLLRDQELWVKIAEDIDIPVIELSIVQSEKNASMVFEFFMEANRILKENGVYFSIYWPSEVENITSIAKAFNFELIDRKHRELYPYFFFQIKQGQAFKKKECVIFINNNNQNM